MDTKSRETIYGASVRAAEARKEADRLAAEAWNRLAVEAWNKRMVGFQGRRSHRLRSATRSTPGLAISK
jgi:hypothetical protein